MTKINNEKRAIFLFRRDLRLEDNTALNQALKEGYSVIPLFIIDPRQFDPHPYRSDSGQQFLIESLQDLDLQLRRHNSMLHLVRGNAEDIVADLIKASDSTALYFNRDYTPFSRTRDQRISERVASAGATVTHFADTLINAPENVLKDDGKPYTVFTPYYKRAIAREAPLPAPLVAGSFLKEERLARISPTELVPETRSTDANSIMGGRTAALEGLAKLGTHQNYQQERDFPALAGTTRLGAHHKFGTISIRETLAAATKLFGRECTLVRELYWRDFFTQIGFHFPHVFERSFNPAYDRIEWHDDPALFAAWCRGETGFPIVDAGMRELNQSGYMHNRVRMIVASFLTKDLHISWREGERYFARKLVDYDPAVNNGSWQWASSSGCDAQPYFRIFNPWLQQQKFDAACTYIKHWVPELRELTPAEIHGLIESRPLFLTGYPAPIVEHSREKRITEDLFNRALKRP